MCNIFKSMKQLKYCDFRVLILLIYCFTHQKMVLHVRIFQVVISHNEDL